MMTKRQKEIIKLLSMAGEPVTADWIAKEIGVSDRTVRSEMKALQSECEAAGAVLESMRGIGYRLKITDQAAFQTAMGQTGNDPQEKIQTDFSDQSNRVAYMLRRFLLEKGAIKLETFEDEMYVSKSTIQHDLKMLRGILKKYGLDLVNRPHYGTQIVGDEYKKRLCLSNQIMRNPDLSMDRDAIQLLDEDLYSKIKEIIIQKVNEYKIEISDISLENLATHVTIACKRIEKGFYIEKLEHEIHKEYPFEKFVAGEIVHEVEKLTGLHFPEPEIDYIIVHLVGTKLLNKRELVEYGEFDEAGHIVRRMLERLKEEMGWDFSGDHELIQALTLHIRPVMNRLRYHMNIRNPLLQQIKMKYPVAFEGAVIASKCIEDYLQMEVGEHEIAYIALHIGVALERMKTKAGKAKKVLVVCASGVGSAKLLYYRLQRLFEHEMEIVDTIHFYKLKDYDLSFIDLVISTIPIQEDLGVPVQVVNTFLEDGDIENIKRQLHPEKTASKVYLDPSRVFIHKDFEDRESAIRFLCGELKKQELVPENYVDLVLEREAASPTSFGNLVAVPHPIKPVTDETFWTVCTLKRPIAWYGRQMVQFICLLNIQKNPKGGLDQMYQHLISVIENKNTVQKIIQSDSVEEVIGLLTKT
ncbi:putative licABCH operon regulator [Weizmannia acidilactici]|uniref:LicABCH operon regulator n=1 Tax=Weizmannia acidilactici TaxID=2607726 RepID=A0A5J4JIV3_9BACI|nr:BglG family transcription antiterminator [Weizmannia acidilactici]GER70347.1 putative licABCH operon regulator [Weizmannia acidilactici]